MTYEGCTASHTTVKKTKLTLLGGHVQLHIAKCHLSDHDIF